MNSLKVSIIVPCYNQAQFLGEALQSVLDQTHANWECIIVNDGSSDNTEVVAKKWIEKDSRFKYLYKQNGGLSSARNAGLDFAKGDYIQFLDSDDCIDKKKLELSIQQLALNENKDKLIAISNYSVFIIETSCPILEVKFDVELFNFEKVLYDWDNIITIPIHCGLFSSDLYLEFKFPENIKAKEDWIMWVSLFRVNINIVHVNHTLSYYRKHQKSMTMTQEILPEYIKAYKYLKKIISDEEFQKLSVALFSKYYESSIVFKTELNQVKNSNTFRVGCFIKKIVFKLRLEKPLKWIFRKKLKKTIISKNL